MAATQSPGAVVTFIASGDTGVTEAGIVIGNPSTTEVLVAYDFSVASQGQVAHCKEMVTSTATTVSNLRD
jgi:hypothetical protein